VVFPRCFAGTMTSQGVMTVSPHKKIDCRETEQQLVVLAVVSRH
jgi:hypothetical protein